MEKHGKKSFHGSKVMEKSWKIGEKIESWKFKKVIEKSWNFSTAYSEARMRNSDNSIYIYRLLQCFGYGRLSIYVLNSKS